MGLGERIKQLRLKSGMSQEKLAELVGVSRQAVTKWESGQTSPSTDNLFKLAEIFGTTVDIMMSADDPQRLDVGRTASLQFNNEETCVYGKENRKRNLKIAGLILLAHLAIYVLLQFIFGYRENHTLLGLLSGTDSKSYLWGWLLHTRLFWAALFINVVSAMFGKIRFALTASVMFFVGILFGELFGPYPQGAAYGYGHYGWAIWGGIYAASIIMGAIAERMGLSEPEKRAKKWILWFSVMSASCILVVIFVLIARPR